MSNFPLRIDFKTAQHDREWDNMLRYWQDAEKEDTITGGWLFDHFVPINGHVEGPCLDGWTLLGALGAATKRLRLGLMVGCNGYRYPAVLAKIATTVDRVSNGRLDMGLGAGWFELEYNMYDIPFPAPADRIRALDEACQVLKMLWTQELSSFEGRYYKLNEARHEPKPVQRPHPPFVIGGRGEKLTLRVVAKHAAMYNIGGGPVEDVVRLNGILDGHCEAIGRDPHEIRRSYQFYMSNPDEVADLSIKIEPFLDAGIDHVVIGVPTEYHSGLMTAIAEQVRPLLNH